MRVWTPAVFFSEGTRRREAERARQRAVYASSLARSSLRGRHNDLTRSHFFDLWQLQPKHSIRQLGLNLRLIHRLRKGELSEERSSAIFAEDMHLVRSFGRGHRSCQGQNVFTEVDLEFRAFHPRHICQDSNCVIVFEYIDQRRIDRTEPSLLSNPRVTLRTFLKIVHTCLLSLCKWANSRTLYGDLPWFRLL